MHATERISLRTTPHAKAVIEQASSLMGMSVSNFILSLAYDKSLQMLKDEQIWQLNQADSALVLDLLENPTAANQALTDLLKLGEALED